VLAELCLLTDLRIAADHAAIAELGFLRNVGLWVYADHTPLLGASSYTLYTVIGWTK